MAEMGTESDPDLFFDWYK